MPVDLTGALLAILFWIVGMKWAVNRIRETISEQELGRRSYLIRLIFWTLIAVIGLAIIGLGIVFIYDALTVGV
jgi:hypothetical protein